MCDIFYPNDDALQFLSIVLQLIFPHQNFPHRGTRCIEDNFMLFFYFSNLFYINSTIVSKVLTGYPPQKSEILSFN
ncbi:MAG: hypothetical protein DWQ05_16220 [Calditrichaeota bacterium]|nr:MAG: hypothetical protein DWQ05_16220 [Calditrichota bacterium]